MTSKGIGDVRRVLGAPQSWIAATFAKPEPPLPYRKGDELLGFVCHHVANWESQVATEAQEYRDQKIDGAAMQRYAYDIRRQCAAVRRILVRYAEAAEAQSPEAEVLRGVVAELARGFSNDPTWREDWDHPAPPVEPMRDRGPGHRRRG
jgi:hypothetical protein